MAKEKEKIVTVNIADEGEEKNEVKITVKRPSSIWSNVASVLANIIGCISPHLTAASKFIFEVIGAQPATNVKVSWPT